MKDRRSGSQPWPCSCGKLLGTIHRDELTLENANVGIVQTRQGALIVQCIHCGVPKSWFNRPEMSLMVGFKGLLRASNDELMGELERFVMETSRNGKSGGVKSAEDL